MFASISADIVSSTSLSIDETIRLKERTQTLFSFLETRFSGFYGRQIKGDYIECIIQNASDVFRIALIIKSCIKSFNITANPDKKKFQTYGIRIAIGIGDMRIIDIEHGILDGEAIYMSGRELEMFDSLNKGTLYIKTTQKKLTISLQTIALLTDAIMNEMTVRQSEVVYYKLLGSKETDIAQTLGISQPAVNRTASSAKWYCIEEALNYFEQIDFDLYE